MIKRHASVSFNLSAVALAMMSVSSSNWAADMTFSPKRVTKEINQKTWICKRCKSKVVSQGQVEVGAGVVSNDAYAFQNLVPSGGDGAVAILSGQGKWVNSSGEVTTVAAKDLGLKRFSVAAGYRSAASGGANISYQELPRYYSDQASTPYVGVAQQASLPENWQSGSTTDDMTNLDESLFARAWESETSKVTVSVYSYNKGPKKLQITRENRNADGDYRFTKLGRMTKEEIENVLPLIQEATNAM